MPAVGESMVPVWVPAAIPAAVRLAAEAGTEVDDLLAELLAEPRAGGAAAARRKQQVLRLEQSADLTEVATDLAGLLWAECEDVPLIATILEEPAARAALEAVAEARRCAGRRLADAATSCATTPGARPAAVPRPGPSLSARWAALTLTDEPRTASGVSGDAREARDGTDARDGADGPRVPVDHVAAAADPDAAGHTGTAVAPERPVPVSAALPAPSGQPVPSPGAGTLAATAGGLRRSVTGAAVAGAAATAILLFGRRLRRA